MRAGDLRYWLEVLQPVTVVDAYGAATVTWEKTATIHAGLNRQSARRSEEVGEHFSTRSVRWDIRDAHTVGINWRVQQLGGELYVVTGKEPNPVRGMVTLVCENVNE